MFLTNYRPWGRGVRIRGELLGLGLLSQFRFCDILRKSNAVVGKAPLASSLGKLTWPLVLTSRLLWRRAVFDRAWPLCLRWGYGVHNGVFAAELSTAAPSEPNMTLGLPLNKDKMAVLNTTLLDLVDTSQL